MSKPSAATPSKPAEKPKRSRKAKPTEAQCEEAAKALAAYHDHIEGMQKAQGMVRELTRDAQAELATVLQNLGAKPFTNLQGTWRIRKTKRGLELVAFDSGAVKL